MDRRKELGEILLGISYNKLREKKNTQLYPKDAFGIVIRGVKINKIQAKLILDELQHMGLIDNNGKNIKVKK